MKRLSVSAIALALGMGSAIAADLPYQKAPVAAPPPPPPLTWNGFYAGLNIGGGWLNNNNDNQYRAYWDPNYPFGGPGVLPGAAGTSTNLFFLPGLNNNNSAQGGVVGGGQAGYNFQFNPSIVIGVETDIQGTSIGNNNNGNWNSSFFPSPFVVPGTAATGILVPVWTGNDNWRNRSISYFGTVRGRLGWLFTPTLLVYGTGGFAYGGSSGFFDNVSTGWTAGGGLEWMFAPNWSAKVEYLYIQANTNNNGNNSGWGWGGNWNNRNVQLNVVRAGVNYHFNWAAPAPVLAKY